MLVGSTMAQALPMHTITAEDRVKLIGEATSEVSVAKTLVETVWNFADVGGSPWNSSLRVTEKPSPLDGGFDEVDVRWDVEHLVGPHTQDINPGSAVFVTLNFSAGDAGPFFFQAGPFISEHPSTEPDHEHVDRFRLIIAGNVEIQPVHLPGIITYRQIISNYTVTYIAEHVRVPELGSSMLCGSGVVLAAIGIRRQRRVTPTTSKKSIR
jgi:hypothetical protein